MGTFRVRVRLRTVMIAVVVTSVAMGGVVRSRSGWTEIGRRWAGYHALREWAHRPPGPGCRIGVLGPDPLKAAYHARMRRLYGLLVKAGGG